MSKQLPKSMLVKYPYRLVRYFPSISEEDGLFSVCMESEDGKSKLGYSESESLDKCIEHTYNVLVELKFIKRPKKKET